MINMSASTKPMYRKYYDVWSEHRAKYGARVALLYQVGGFFEIYDTENLTTGTTQANIREIAELCQLSLSVHPIEGSDNQTLFGGFPEHSLGKFEKILVQAGFTVVVVVQRKGPTGAVEERLVDHIASPGCYVEGAKERRLVGCILESLGDGVAALHRVYWATVALDVATGRIWFAEGVDRDRLHQFLCVNPPSELVLWSDGGPSATYWSDSLKSACSATHLRCLTPASVAIEEATLEKFWNNSHKRLDWIATQPQARRCLAALMSFAREHVPSSLRSLGLPESWVPTGEVRLGNAALEQLGLLSLKGSGTSDSDKQSLLGLMDQCRSIAGRRLMRSRLLRPITDVIQLNNRLDQIDRANMMMRNSETVATTERSLRSLYDMSRLFRKLELGTATMGDMGCLLRSYEAASALLSIWSPEPSDLHDYLGWIAVRWNTAATTELARLGESTPVSKLPWTAGVYANVDAKFAEGLSIRHEAEMLCREWSGKGRGEQLYLDDAEGGGFRVTGTKRRISAVQASLRDEGDTTAVLTTYKSSAVLETAGLEAISMRHRSWMRLWNSVWTDAWSAACAEIVKRGSETHRTIEAWCAEIDLAWTVARLAKEWLWVRPSFDAATEGYIDVTNLRHPILERIQSQGSPYVSHTIALGSLDGPMSSHAGFLLYGMNASGKSSLMKAIGLCTLLAQCGFPVPAAICRISPFTSIFTRILGNDNLWAGLSSFAVEMTEFREILRFSDERSLVLGDELCSGTESLSATALVAAGVETLAARKAKFVFATHLHELATLPDIAGLATVKAVHLKVHYDAAADRLVYDRHLAPGAGSALYGLEVCRALDLPTGYLDRATAIRQSLAGWTAPTQSVYSTAVAVMKCAVCGSGSGLETHHIRPQADAATAAAEGFDLNAPGNLVCLCTGCHDDHHAGRLTIEGWQDTSAGPCLVWRRTGGGTSTAPEVIAWIRDQRRLKVRIATIQRMTKQIFGMEVTDKEIRGIRP